MDHDPFFSAAPSPREMALGSDAEIGALYNVLQGTPHFEVMRRMVRAAYQGVALADRQDSDTLTLATALNLLRETQRQAPTIEWAKRRDTFLQGLAKPIAPTQSASDGPTKHVKHAKHAKPTSTS